MTFGDRIKELRREQGWSLNMVAYKMQISPAALSRYESGRYEPKSLSKINDFADLYNVSTDYLLGKSPYRNIDEFLASSEGNALKGKLEKTFDYMQNNSVQTMFMIPLYSKVVDEKNMSNFLQGYIPVAPEIYNMNNPENYFYLLVNDDSINLKIDKNDFALIKKQNTATDGDIIIIIINNKEIIFRKWKKINEQFILLEPVSNKQDIEPIILDLQKTEFKIIGKVIGLFGKIS